MVVRTVLVGPHGRSPEMLNTQGTSGRFTGRSTPDQDQPAHTTGVDGEDNMMSHGTK